MTEQEQAAADKLAEEKAAMKAEADAEIKAAEEAVRNANKNQAEKDADLVSKLVSDKLDSTLKPIKEKLDSAFKQRDDALARLAILEQKEKEANLKQMEAEGKWKEAADLRLAEEKAKNAALEKQNTELSRDVAVRDALKSYTFRNDKAADMAFREITSNLVQNDQRQWVHRSGVSIRDFCDAFSKDEEQSFLFKAKPNSGAGTTGSGAGNTGNAGDTNKNASLFKKSQAEVLKMAAEGKFGVLPQY